jgi:polysaccharide pyruvyl transferase WcaK-like protein
MPDSTDRPLSVSLIGATITGNRGAESMLRAALQRIPEYCRTVRFTLLSLYPGQDAAENLDPDLQIVPCKPMHLVFVAFPVAVVSGLMLRWRLPYRWLFAASPPVRSIHESDLVIDLSGISFVDGRGGGILLYNTLVVLLPALLERPLMKYSQAFGPFRTAVNRWLASFCLPKVTRIAVRGEVSHGHLRQLGIDDDRIEPCADAAFAMEIGPAAEERVTPILKTEVFHQPAVAISPSSVVDAYCAENGVDYVATLKEFIEYLIDEKGYGIVILAHSARPDSSSSKNNDLPACRRLVGLVDRPDRCVFLDQTLNAESLRAVIGACRFLVASRFHAMVSGLATTTPTMLIGWSHKYAEVLHDFQLQGNALDYGELSLDRLKEHFERLEIEEEHIVKTIRARLPAVVESSLGNARVASELLAATSQRGL